MMVVVVIIGLFAALAAPSVISLVRDQRTRREAISLVDVLRDGRARALGRGTAVMVEYTTSANQADFVVREAVGVNSLPTPSCMTPTWTAADSSVLAELRPGRTTVGSAILVAGQYSNAANTPTSSLHLEVCFTPSGREFIKEVTAGPAWSPLLGNVQFTYQRLEGGAGVGIVRTVQLNADGVTKVQL